MAKQLTAPGCIYSIVARVDTTIYSPDQKWTLDVSAGQTDVIAETNEIIIPGDAMMCRKTRQHAKDRNRLNLLGTGPGSLATFVTRAIERIVGKGNAKVEYGAGTLTVALPESATTAQIAIVENLLDRMLPKDVTGEIDELPLGYMMLEFLESTGTQWIFTGIAVASDVQLDFDAQYVGEGSQQGKGTGAGYFLHTDYPWDNANNPPFGVAFYTKNGNDIRLFSFGNARPFIRPYSTARFRLGYNGTTGELSLNGELKLVMRPGKTGTTSGCLGLFVTNRVSSMSGRNPVNYTNGRVFSLTIRSAAGGIDFLPTLDSTGRPCMYDLVTKKPFYNAATTGPDFIVGLTIDQSLDLANLPVTASGNLTVSLPWDAQWDERVQNALDTASTKGWTITVQYRDPEIATSNIPTSFLESTGTQYIYLDDELTTRVSCSFTVTPTKIYEANYFCGRNENYYIYAKIKNNQVAVGQVPYSNDVGFEASTQETYNVELNRQKRQGIIRCGEEEKLYYIAVAASNPKALIFWGGQSSLDNSSGNVTYRSHARMSDISVSHAGVPTHTFITSLDPAGTPCLHDTISDQNFYNAGTGAFIAGFDTVEQARKLATLPDVTAETDETKKSLTVSLPLELAFDASVQSALSIANSRGWTITVQYRESELTTDHIDADFLESTGTQGITFTIPFSLEDQTTVEYMLTGSSPESGILYQRAFGGTRNNGHVSNGASGADELHYAWNSTCYLAASSTTQSIWAAETSLLAYRIQLRDKNTAVLTNGKITLNGFSNTATKVERAVSFTSGYQIFGWGGGTSFGTPMRLYSFKHERNGRMLVQLVSTIDSTGTPCMHDTVSGQNFYNANTAAGATPFIVGFETTEKAAISLSKLPVTAGSTLTVSLPAEAEDASTWVPTAIDIATNRGWTIITQYRED